MLIPVLEPLHFSLWVNIDKIIYEAADLWFHSLVALTYYGVNPEQVLNELARREGLSGLVEKASRSE